jgi:hypothetical protein
VFGRKEALLAIGCLGALASAVFFRIGHDVHEAALKAQANGVDEHRPLALRESRGFIRFSADSLRVPLGSSGATAEQVAYAGIADIPCSWPEAKERLRGIVLSFDEAEHKGMTRRALRWDRAGNRSPDLDSKTLNPLRKKISDLDREQIRELVADYDAVLENMAITSMSLFMESLSHYFEGERFQLYGEGEQPTETERLPEDQPSSYTTRMTVGWGGWTCVVDFRSSEYPAFEDHLKEVDAIRRERAAAVAAYIDGLP